MQVSLPDTLVWYDLRVMLVLLWTKALVIPVVEDGKADPRPQTLWYVL